MIRSVSKRDRLNRLSTPRWILLRRGLKSGATARVEPATANESSKRVPTARTNPMKIVPEFCDSNYIDIWYIAMYTNNSRYIVL